MIQVADLADRRLALGRHPPDLTAGQGQLRPVGFPGHQRGAGLRGGGGTLAPDRAPLVAVRRDDAALPVAGGDAFEYEQDGRFHFDVELKAPLIGRLVRYRGWLVPAA